MLFKSGMLFRSIRIAKYFALNPLVSSKPYSTYLGEWTIPKGFETGISIYNSAAAQKVPLILRNKNVATWYMCGPTVYDESHIGHASCYVKFDTIRRIMEDFFGINVLLLMGITDIDDKIIKKSLAMGRSIFDVSTKYESEFFDDMKALRIKHPHCIMRVTEYIPYIIQFTEKLIEKDYAYSTEEGNVYFMVSKGCSANIVEDELHNEASTDPSKRDKRDFALWKHAKDDEPFWESPWGKGRPGWHIECSTMATKLFGSHLDLHSGGYDLLFPHHSNEKSQSEAYHSCSQWGNYWIHSGLLQIDGDTKMSKSIGNTISIKSFLNRHSVNDFRILNLQSLYRKNISFCEETLEGAIGLHKKLHNFLNDCDLYINGDLPTPCLDETLLLSKLENTKADIMSHLSNDFNTCQALLTITELIDYVNESLKTFSQTSSKLQMDAIAITACSSYVDRFLEMLGVTIMCKKKLNRRFVHLVNEIVNFRNAIRLFSLCKIEIVSSKTAEEHVHFLHINFQNKIKIMNENKELLPENTEKILELTTDFYLKALDFATNLELTNDVINANKQLLKQERKKRAQFLVLCDELRSSFADQGIAIKDFKDSSCWVPATNLR